MAAAMALPPFNGVITSRLPWMTMDGTVDLGSRGERIRISVAGGQVGENDAGARAFKQALGAAEHPQARRQGAAERCAIAFAPDRHHVDGRVVVGFRGIEQIVRHPHRRRRSDQAKAADFAGWRAAVSSAISDPME